MAYEVYYHKQQPNGIAQSPDNTIGVTQNQIENRAILKGAVAATIGRQLLNGAQGYATTLIDLSGDSRLKRNFELAQNIASSGLGVIGGFAVSTGAGLAALAAVSLNLAFESGKNQVEEVIQQNQNAYDRQLLGTRIQKFSVGGQYYG